MKPIGIDELTELANCRSDLEDVLQRLDELGAGIAAIHVDAAIAHLAGNMSTASQECEIHDVEPSLASTYVAPLTRH